MSPFVHYHYKQTEIKTKSICNLREQNVFHISMRIVWNNPSFQKIRNTQRYDAQHTSVYHSANDKLWHQYQFTIAKCDRQLHWIRHGWSQIIMYTINALIFNPLMPIARHEFLLFVVVRLCLVLLFPIIINTLYIMITPDILVV